MESSYRVVRLTLVPGIHTVKMNNQCTYFVDTYSNPNTPKSSELFLLPSFSELKKTLFDSCDYPRTKSSNLHEIDIQNAQYTTPLRSVLIESLLLKNIAG